MNKNDVTKLIMYYEIKKRKDKGFSTAWIARKLGIDYRTVKKYLKMSEDEYSKFLESQTFRSKILDGFEDFVRQSLEDCPEASSAQIFDWLKENFQELPTVNEKTVFNFTLYVRRKHNIPKPFVSREFSKVEELPYGKQAQVDFGEYIMRTDQGKRKKIYFFSMVLSRSRYKFVYFSDTFFTTITTIEAHEKAFEYFEGLPEQVVYDQDTLLLVSENYGDLLLTQQFRSYVSQRGFKTHFCRKSDPQTKGKIENVIKYIKYNLLRGRIYVNIQLLNGQGIAWLNRTANAKVHAATKLVPQMEWETEKAFLKPISKLFVVEKSLVSYKVRKDNTILFKSNFYRVPLGTYQGPDTIAWLKQTPENELIIYDSSQTELARHQIDPGRGKLIGNNNFKRDYSAGIDNLITELSALFDDPVKAGDYFNLLRKTNSRYIRDQLQLIKTVTKTYSMKLVNQALDFCTINNIYKATDFKSVVIKLQADKNNPQEQEQPIVVKTLDKSSFKIIPQKSSISNYQNIMD
jgi:transposase